MSAKIEYKKGGTLNLDRLGVCTITRVYPAGTVDVVAASGRYYRVTGLRIYQERESAERTLC